MDTCAVETGLLKKKPCGQNAVAKCANCEIALCTKHAVARLNANKQRTGKFMCAECDRANKEEDISTPAPKPAAGGAPAAPKPAAAPPATAPATTHSGTTPAPAASKEFKLEETGPIPAPAPEVKAPPAKAPPAAQPATKPAPAASKEFKLEDTGPIEFTPTKK